MTQMVSGIDFIHLEDFIKRKWGSNGLEIYKEQDKFKNQKIFEDKLYPFDDYIYCLKKIQQLFEDSGAPFQVGWHRANNFLLVKSIEEYNLEILDKVAMAWPKFNNFGEVTIDKQNEKMVVILISKYNSDPVYCDRTRGFFAGLLDKIKNFNYEIKEINCVCNGASSCEYHVENLTVVTGQGSMI